MAPTPVRSGFRVAGPDPTPAVYDHPPLVESWLGIDFAVGDDLHVAKADCPPEDAEALRAALGPEWPGQWKNTASPAIKELTNVMGDRVLHLTSQGFSYGWLGYSGERYPRYEAVRDGFVTVLDAIRKLKRCGEKADAPRRWSVRYVNRIPRGTVWSTFDDWKFFTLWQPKPLSGLGVDLSGFQARWDFPLEAERGSLAIEFRHVSADSPSEAENLWITLMTSGAIEDADSSVFDGLDFGREVIVRSFNELVSADAKTYWGVATKSR